MKCVSILRESTMRDSGAITSDHSPIWDGSQVRPAVGTPKNDREEPSGKREEAEAVGTCLAPIIDSSISTRSVNAAICA